MSVESWQIKRYYPPRVLIGVSDILDPPLPSMTLVCLTGSELLILRNLLDYCHRRSTFVVTYGTDTYVAPDAETWDVLQEIVAELEGKLMAGCEDLLDKFDEIIAALTDQNSILDDIPTALALIETAIASITTGLGTVNDTLTDHTDWLSCICDKIQVLADDPGTRAIVDERIDDNSLQTTDPYPSTATPADDEDACAIAQLAWAFMYETLTEIIQPTQEKTVSILLPIALAVIASWVGSPLLGIPVGAVLVLLWDIIEIWVAGSLESVATSIFVNKDELVCAAYKELAKTSNLGAVSSAMGDVINEIEDLSPIDKLVMRGLCSPWNLDLMSRAWTNETSWATARVSAGYCDSCPEDPIVGSDWIAIPYVGDDKEIVIVHTPENWDCGCFDTSLPAGATIAGVFYEVTYKEGDKILKRMQGPCTCSGSYLWPNTSDSLGVNWFFCRDPDHFDEAECLTAVHSGAIEQGQFQERTGETDIQGTWQLGFYGYDEAHITIHYLVFLGTENPYE
jgi:hypothetical protein